MQRTKRARRDRLKTGSTKMSKRFYHRLQFSNWQVALLQSRRRETNEYMTSMKIQETIKKNHSAIWAYHSSATRTTQNFCSRTDLSKKIRRRFTGSRFTFWNFSVSHFFFLFGFLPLALLLPLGEVGSCAASSAASWAAISSWRLRSASRNFCLNASRGLFTYSRAASTAAWKVCQKS